MRPLPAIIRPTLFYGPRDTAFLPRLIRTLREGGAWLIGDGENLLNAVYVADVAELAIAAAQRTRAAGQAYNACTRGDMTQSEVMNLLCQAVGLPPLRRRIPYWAAHNVGLFAEIVGHTLRRTHSPSITRHALSAFVRPVTFDNDKARHDLGWRPRTRTPEGLALTLAWMNKDAPELLGGTSPSLERKMTGGNTRSVSPHEDLATSEEPWRQATTETRSC
ncbi:MAG TPA: NAD-dependent epimerase/dehydratase family protein [Thermoguttaceae bacterium]|nr:NAD-dependent epimerase/dehydratase family protein [Thermoguttaceae bacterium]